MCLWPLFFSVAWGLLIGQTTYGTEPDMSFFCGVFTLVSPCTLPCQWFEEEVPSVRSLLCAQTSSIGHFARFHLVYGFSGSGEPGLRGSTCLFLVVRPRLKNKQTDGRLEPMPT